MPGVSSLSTGSGHLSSADHYARNVPGTVSSVSCGVRHAQAHGVRNDGLQGSTPRGEGVPVAWHRVATRMWAQRHAVWAHTRHIATRQGPMHKSSGPACSS